MSTSMSEQYNAAMQGFTKLSYSASEQHNELAQVTLSRDLVDTDAHHSLQTLC